MIKTLHFKKSENFIYRKDSYIFSPYLGTSNFIESPCALVNSFLHWWYHLPLPISLCLSLREPTLSQTIHIHSILVEPVEKRCSNRNAGKNGGETKIEAADQRRRDGHRETRECKRRAGCVSTRTNEGVEKKQHTHIYFAFSSFWTTHSKTQCFSLRRVFRLVRLPGKRRE